MKTNKRAAHSPRAKKGTPAQGFLSQLRVALAASAGKERVSRASVAKFLKVAVGTLVNWENGKSISPRLLKGLENAVQRASGAKGASKVTGTAKALKAAVKQARGRSVDPGTAMQIRYMLSAFEACGSNVSLARTRFDQAASFLS